MRRLAFLLLGIAQAASDSSPSAGLPTSAPTIVTSTKAPAAAPTSSTEAPAAAPTSSMRAPAAAPTNSTKARATCLDFDFNRCARRPSPLPVHTLCAGASCSQEADESTCCRQPATCQNFSVDYCPNNHVIKYDPSSHACVGEQCQPEDCCAAPYRSMLPFPFNLLCDMFGLDFNADPTIRFASGASLLVALMAACIMLHSMYCLRSYGSTLLDCTKTQLGKIIRCVTCKYFCRDLSTEIHDHEEQVRDELHELLLREQSATSSTRRRSSAHAAHSAADQSQRDHLADAALDYFAVATRASMVIIMLGFFIQVMSFVRVDSEQRERTSESFQKGLRAYPSIQMAIHKSKHHNVISNFILVAFPCLLFAWISAKYVYYRIKVAKDLLAEFRKKGAPLDNRESDDSSFMETMHESMRCKENRCREGKWWRCYPCNIFECPTCKGSSFQYQPGKDDLVYVTHTDFYPEFMGRCGKIKDIKDGTQTLSHKVEFADSSESGSGKTLPYGWFRENALVKAKVVDSMHYICVHKPEQLKGRYYRDSANGEAYVHENKKFEIVCHQGRWYWGEVNEGRIWFTSFEQSLIPPIPPCLTEQADKQAKQTDASTAWNHWQQELGLETGEQLEVAFDVFYANGLRDTARTVPSTYTTQTVGQHCVSRSSRATQDRDFKAHIMKSYNHTQYSQTSRHKNLTSNSLLLQAICLGIMWLFPTNDFLPCSLEHNFPDSETMPTVDWTLEAIRLANRANFKYNNNAAFRANTNSFDLVSFELFSCNLTQQAWPKLQSNCGRQTRINTLAWHTLNLCSVWTAVRAVWIQGLFRCASPRSWKGFWLDPMTYFIALMQIIGACCYYWFLLQWSKVRCTQSEVLFVPGTFDCGHYCNSTQYDEVESRSSCRTWQDTSVVLALLAMLCRVCRDYAYSAGVWEQRYSIFLPFALLMLHSLVTQNSEVIFLGVIIFVLATFFSASIGKF